MGHPVRCSVRSRAVDYRVRSLGTTLSHAQFGDIEGRNNNGPVVGESIFDMSDKKLVTYGSQYFGTKFETDR